MINNLEQIIKETDSKLSIFIQSFLLKYYPAQGTQFFSLLIPTFAKLLIYLLFPILIFSALKLYHPYSPKITFLIIATLTLTAISVFMVFLGFLQLAFTF